MVASFTGWEAYSSIGKFLLKTAGQTSRGGGIFVTTRLVSGVYADCANLIAFKIVFRIACKPLAAANTPRAASSQKKVTAIDIMTIEVTPQSHQSSAGAYPERPTRKGSWVRVVIYLVLVCALGLVAWRIYNNQQQNAQNSARQAKALLDRPTPVQVTPVEMRPMPIYLTALGTVTPYFSVTVKARVSGELLPVKFTEGQMVHEGDTIMVIDPKPYQAALDEAKGTLAHDVALLKNAQAEFARYKALFDAGVVSKETLDADEAAMGQYQGAI
jgi:Biotin-lipoyl like